MSKKTRDSQNKRLTTSRYVEVGDCIHSAFSFIDFESSDDDDVSEYDILVLKVLIFHIWVGDKCYIPYTHWKLLRQLVFEEFGGYDNLRVQNPTLAEALIRPRHRFVGRQLKSHFRSRFFKKRGDD